jgi:hypothetical protein
MKNAIATNGTKIIAIFCPEPIAPNLNQFSSQCITYRAKLSPQADSKAPGLG